MRKILVFLMAVFVVLGPTPSSAWDLRDKSVPFDSLMAQNIERWRNQHNWEISTLLTNKQEIVFDQIVRGILNWAYTHGNQFDRDEFLTCFNERDDSVLTIAYPEGGLALVIRGAYVRVELDKSRPEFLDTEILATWPEEGRWYAEIGCSSHSQIFYFLAATPDKIGYTACHLVPTPESP